MKMLNVTPAKKCPYMVYKYLSISEMPYHNGLDFKTTHVILHVSVNSGILNIDYKQFTYQSLIISYI